MTSPSPASSEVYCQPEHITLKADMLPREPPVEQWIQHAADHMNSYIGQIYELPLQLDPLRADHLADILLLRRINAWLAMGQIIMNANASAEDSNLHVYGKWMYDEANKELARISAGRTVLEAGIPLVEPDTRSNGPLITNRDSGSFVDAFYRSNGSAHIGPTQWGVGID